MLVCRAQGDFVADINPKSTALVIVDPQNDFLSEGGVVWDLVGKQVVEHIVPARLKTLAEKSKAAGITVFYSPHYYDKEFQAWENNNFIDTMMFERKMFERGKWGRGLAPRPRARRRRGTLRAAQKPQRLPHQ